MNGFAYERSFDYFPVNSFPVNCSKEKNGELIASISGWKLECRGNDSNKGEAIKADGCPIFYSPRKPLSERVIRVFWQRFYKQTDASAYSSRQDGLLVAVVLSSH